MIIAVGGDHAGFGLKNTVGDWLRAMGHEVRDLGTCDTTPVDYPDFAAAVAHDVVAGKAERGIIVCGSGAGACIAANKVKGARCAMTNDTYTAHQCVEHDEANCIAMASRVVGVAVAQEIVQAFVNAQFTGEERHVRRLAKVAQLEAEFGQ